jgi:hypothetical protein
MTKICSHCKQEKDIHEFRKDKHSKDGVGYICKICDRKYYKEYMNKLKQDPIKYKAYLEKRHKSVKKYLERLKENHPEKYYKYQEYQKENQKKYLERLKETNPEKYEQLKKRRSAAANNWQKRNREKAYAVLKRWREKNPERNRELMRINYRENTSGHRRAHKKYYEKNKELITLKYKYKGIEITPELIELKREAMEMGRNLSLLKKSIKEEKNESSNPKTKRNQ